MMSETTKAFAEWREEDGVRTFTAVDHRIGMYDVMQYAEDAFAAGAAWEQEDQGFDHLMLTVKRLLKHYPKDTIVCSHDVPDVGARFTAALRDLVEVVDSVVCARGEDRTS